MKFLKKSAKGWDKTIVIIGTIAFIPLLILPGLDAIRYQWSQVSIFLKIAGFAGVFTSFFLVFWVIRENRYLTRIVEIQEDRGHKVITTGPYQYVRHPMYVGVIIFVICLPLALGSLIALFISTLIILVFLIRTSLEDKTLQKELSGYKEYAEQVRYRLIPGIW